MHFWLLIRENVFQSSFSVNIIHPFYSKHTDRSSALKLILLFSETTQKFAVFSGTSNKYGARLGFFSKHLKFTAIFGKINITVDVCVFCACCLMCERRSAGIQHII